ncbi:uncharacterized protein EV154DRAFT_587953 [Mucor mucedo]|uniref:uncharacterized protein n=1 Tax=Mucor mucedo TaxID=29922 RepID=UPI002220AD4A|nr:uncharacterized protein EV154DRAFT_587953 [Mucor mucedo]KAI7891627.1 hypothetical protein EV154DRAFT_587953 [Mucor mucedo]
MMTIIMTFLITIAFGMGLRLEIAVWVFIWFENFRKRNEKKRTKKNIQIEKREIIERLFQQLLADKVIPSSWNFKSVGKRFERQLAKYRDTERDMNSIGFGLTADDIKRGLTFIEIKFEHLCIGFSRLAALHGVRPNITPYSWCKYGGNSWW